MTNLTLPNLLSLARIAAAPFIVVAMTEARYDVALGLFIAAAVTDLLDGYIARRFGWTSPLGALLDPAGDKLLLTAVYVALAFQSLPADFHFPVWLTVLVLSRDLLIVSVSLIMFLGQGKKRFPPTRLGKITTFVLIIDAGGALLANVRPVGDAWHEAIIWTAAAVTIASGVDYILVTSSMISSASQDSPE